MNLLEFHARFSGERDCIKYLSIIDTTSQSYLAVYYWRVSFLLPELILS